MGVTGGEVAVRAAAAAEGQGDQLGGRVAPEGLLVVERMSDDDTANGERQRSASSSRASTMALKAVRQAAADRPDSAAG
ncbi:hypothetical protein ACH47Z_41600 [Streptomyces sp. NPDC020192]|uniref:hypothetical protein n=1 Tax=Streptomyces sp. NPDC020192 TaxID=3365066 RepID=UPI0037B71359